ncbi:MAG: aldo/keto reductase [Oscillospiraceae bacterium]|jgi:diketogulonate reductase-like aldo/keto reductase|nr:aldo/keto reductase [Oscillospiraceae bacterium]
MDFDIRSTIKLSNGIEMPRFGLGVWQVKDENELRTSVKSALENKYWHIDTAQIYGNEHMVGQAIADFGKRDDLFVVTKLWNADQANAEAAFEASLKNLQTDHVDLYLMHWPCPKRGTYVQAWKSMIDIYKSGRAKAIGVSNFKQEHLERAIDATGFVPMVNQVERHPMYQQDELAAYCRAKGIVMEAYSPLTSGHMSDIAPTIEPIAKKHGKSVAQVILRWHLQGGWVIIPKSVTPSRVAENARIFDFNLDDDDMKIIATLDRNVRFLPDPDEADF